MATIGVLVVAGAAPAHAHSAGVVFVHGTGDQSGSFNCSGSGNSYKCVVQNAVDDYWSQDFINKVKDSPNFSGTDRPYAVVGCPLGSARPWTYNGETGSAYCVANQIVQFINNYPGTFSELIIVTHSGGSNVVRYILQQYSSNSNFTTVRNLTKEVVFVAGVTKGTYLANVANDTGIGKFINGVVDFAGKGDFTDDGTKFIRTYEMASYNNDSALFGGYNNPINGVTVNEGWGTYPDASIWRSKTWCGGYHLSVGLNLLHKLYLDGYDGGKGLNDCSDGFIPCLSAGALTASGAGTKIFGGQSKDSSRYRNHHQTRRDCNGAGDKIRDAVDDNLTVHAEVDDSKADVPPTKWDACTFSEPGTVSGYQVAGCPSSYLGDGWCDADCLAIYGRDAVPTFDGSGNVIAWGAEDCDIGSSSSAWSASFDGRINTSNSTVYVTEYINTPAKYYDSSYCPESWLDDGWCDECHLAITGSDGNDCKPSTVETCSGLVYDDDPWNYAYVYNSPSNTYWDTIVGTSCGDGMCTSDECTVGGGTTCSSDCSHSTEIGTINLCD